MTAKLEVPELTEGPLYTVERPILCAHCTNPANTKHEVNYLCRSCFDKSYKCHVCLKYSPYTAQFKEGRICGSCVYRNETYGKRYRPCYTPQEFDLTLPCGERIYDEFGSPYPRSRVINLGTFVDDNQWYYALFSGNSQLYQFCTGNRFEVAKKHITKAIEQGKKNADIYDDFWKDLRLKDWKALYGSDEGKRLSTVVSWINFYTTNHLYKYDSQMPSEYWGSDKWAAELGEYVKRLIRDHRSTCITNIETVRRALSKEQSFFATRYLGGLASEYVNARSCWFGYGSTYGHSRCVFRHSGGIVFLSEDRQSRFLVLPLTNKKGESPVSSRFQVAYNWQEEEYEEVVAYLVFNAYYTSGTGVDGTSAEPYARALMGDNAEWEVMTGMTRQMFDLPMYVNDGSCLLRKKVRGQPNGAYYLYANGWNPNNSCLPGGGFCWKT